MVLLKTTRVIFLFFILVLSACGGGTLSTLPSELLEVQRQAMLTRTVLSGSWDGVLSDQGSTASETIRLVFTQPNAISLDGSLLLRERIELGGFVSRDTFALINGVFEKPEVRFNLSSGGVMVVFEGAPVLYRGELTENNYMSGVVVADKLLIGNWEARLGAIPAILIRSENLNDRRTHGSAPTGD